MAMTDMEKMIRLVLNSVYTSLPCKVLEYDENSRYARCKMMIQTDKEADIPLIRVPILRMVGGSVPLKPGMIIPVWFSKYTLGEFAIKMTSIRVKGPLEDIQFNRNSAYGLPFLFDEKLNIKMPEFVEFDTRVIFKETVLMEKEVECLKDVKMRAQLSVDSNTTIKGNTEIAGNATIAGKMSSPNYNNHKHMEQGDGKLTSTPQ